MSKKFSISDNMLNGISKNIDKVNELEAKSNFNVQYIDINKIKRNEKNFYEIVDVEELAEDIKLNGLNHNLVVRQLENSTYELISGERRFTALNNLVNEGETLFALVPCKVVDKNDIDSEIILIQANSQTRELSESEKLKQVERLTFLYKEKKSNGETVPGKIRELIASDLKLSPTQVGRYERINNNLIPELKELLEQGNLTTSNASEFSTLSEENQKVILDIINSKVEISKDEATKLKVKLKNIEDEKNKEIKLKQSLISHNSELKRKLNTSLTEKSEIASQIEGQLRVDIKGELEEKYSLEITSIKNEAKKNFDEKQKLKRELDEIKSNSTNGELMKENYALNCEIKKVQSSLHDTLRQFKKMEKLNLSIDPSIIDLLDKAIIDTHVLKMIKNGIK